LRLAATAAAQTRPAAGVAYSFVVIGCNRVLGPDVSPENPSTANLPQLERSFTEITELKPPPAIVFFAGDLVMGLNSDLGELRDQLQSWVEVYRNSALGRDPLIRLVALPGNHEVLIGKKGSQSSNPGAEQVWLSVMGPYIVGANGPGSGGPDGLQTDQSKLTYSFDYRETHFVIVDTDPQGAPATVPVHWIGSDLQTASNDPRIKHIFVVGHKPAFPPPFASPEQSLNSNPGNRDTFWQELDTAKVTAYLTSHAHVWDISQPDFGHEPSAARVWQVVAGNGGTKLDSGWAAIGETPYFGFTLVRVMNDGNVIVTSYGRNFDPTDYLAPSPPAVYPTTIRLTMDLTP
jgi:Calcineurin-like phosphoesterase